MLAPCKALADVLVPMLVVLATGACRLPVPPADVECGLVIAAETVRRSQLCPACEIGVCVAFLAARTALTMSALAVRSTCAKHAPALHVSHSAVLRNETAE